MTITTKSYFGCHAVDPAGIAAQTEQPGQIGNTPDPERVLHAEALLADAMVAAPEHAPQAAANVLYGDRAELATLTEQVKAAGENLRRCGEPVRRLREVIAECDAVERDLETRRQRHLAELGEWLAGIASPDLRPVPNPELLAAEQHLVRWQRHAAAARSAIPDHETVSDAAARHLAALAERRNAVHRTVILAAVTEHIDRHLIPALRTAQQCERSAWQVADCLSARNDHAAVATIKEAIAAS